jgi:hypothetical protein
MIRTLAQRKADVLAKLTAPVADAWVATADQHGPHLVPLTLAWLRDRIVLATEGTSRTARAMHNPRLALGGTRDVVMIDAVLQATHAVTAAPAWVGEGYAAAGDWDPRRSGDPYVFLVLEPRRIQAWREADEIPGRTVMRDGSWLS